MDDALFIFLGLAVVIAPFVGIALHLRSSRRMAVLQEEVRNLTGRLARFDSRLNEVSRATTKGAVESGDEPAAKSAMSAVGAPAVEAEPVANPLPKPVTVHAAPPVRATPAATAAPASAPPVDRQKEAAAADLSSRDADTRADERLSLEAFLGGRVLLVVGVVVVLIGLAFFLKVAIDRGWLGALGPGMRIGLGAAAGVALLVAGDRVRARGLTVFGHALMGGGLGALYLSNFFATTWYDLIGQQTAFVVVGGVTAVGAFLAIRRDAKLLAWLGFLGAFLAPALLGRDVDALESLTVWLIVVDLGLLAVLARRSWQGLDVMAFVASAVYFAFWYERWYDLEARQTGVALSLPEEAPARLGVACLCLSALLATKLLLNLLPAGWRRARLAPTSLAAAVGAGVAALAMGHALLFPASRGALGVSVLVTGAVYVAGARWIARRSGGRGDDTDTLDVVGIASLAVALAVLLEGDALTPAWAAAGLAAVVAGCRMPGRPFLVSGLVLMGLATVHVFSDRMPLHHEPFLPLVNISFLSAASPAVAMLLAGAAMRRVREDITTQVRPIVITVGAWLLGFLVAADLLDHAVLDPGRYGDAAHELGLVFASLGLATLGALFTASLGRGRDPVPTAGIGPVLGALLLALLVNVTGNRPGFTPVVNSIFGAGLFATAAAVFAGRLLRGQLRVVAWSAVGVAAFSLVTSEIFATGRFAEIAAGSRAEAEFRAQVWVSVAWGLYGAVLLWVGFRRDLAALRWSALGVFALTLGKIVFVDMSQLDTLYRIGSFLGVGGLLVAASFLYQRARRTGPESGPTTQAPAAGAPSPE